MDTSTSTGPDETTGSSSSGEILEPVPCGEGLVCPAGEVCVMPCCGGPAPACGPVDAAMCPPGTIEVGSCQFGNPCGPGQLCCEDGPCMADPPFCATAFDLACSDSECISPCSGPLVDGVLSCECA